MAQTMEQKRQRVRSSSLISGREDVDAVREVLFGVRSDGTWTDLPEIVNNFDDVVEQFAEDLNTKQFHFLLELLQNCCDNLYHDDVVPAVEFELLSPGKLSPALRAHAPHGALIVRNNEIGFRCKDLFHLSQVSRSSKKGIQGFIGQKGIGFKCVFNASARPHIISGNLRVFYSDTIEDDDPIKLKYLPPHWIEDDSLVDAICKDCPGEFRDGTTIFLPLRNSFIHASLSTELSKISSATTIFLPKVSKISIKDDLRVRMLKFERDGEPFASATAEDYGCDLQVIKGRDQDGCEWYLCSSTADMFDIEEATRSGPGFVGYSPQITLAFPAEAWQREQLQAESKLLAFLPTELNTNLPCYINSDFLLIASRDSIKLESEWNKRLLECAAEQYAAFLELMIHRAEPGSKEMIEWLRLLNPTPLEAIVKEYFIKPAERSLKDRRVCLVTRGEGGDEYARPGDCHSFPCEALELINQCESLPADFPPNMLHLRIVANYAALKQIHKLGARQKMSYDFEDLLSQNIDWIQQQGAANEDWLVALVEWFKNFGTDGSFLKQILPLEPIDGTDIFASGDAVIYLRSEAGHCQKYCPAEVGRVVKASIADKLSAWLQDWLAEHNVAQPLFTEIHFATEMSSRERLGALKQSANFDELSYMIGRTFSDKKMSNKLKDHLVRIRSGDIVRFEETYCESEILKLKPLWKDSHLNEFTRLESNTLHPSYAGLTGQPLEQLSRSWHSICGTGIPVPPHTRDSFSTIFHIPPKLEDIIERLKYDPVRENISEYKRTIQAFVEWILAARKHGVVHCSDISISPTRQWVLTQDHQILIPSLVFHQGPAFDGDHILPVAIDGFLVTLSPKIQLASVETERDCRQYLTTLAACYPKVTAKVADMFDTVCSHLIYTWRKEPLHLPDVETACWTSAWKTGKSDPDEGAIQLDELLRQVGTKNWAHPRFRLPKTSAMLRSRNMVGRLSDTQIVNLITGWGLNTSIRPHLSDLYNLLGSRLDFRSRQLPGKWVLCHDQWCSLSDLYWERDISNLGPIPQAFETFQKLNIANDKFLCGTKLESYFSRAARTTGPTAQHFAAAMTWVATSKTITFSQKLEFARWSYRKLDKMKSSPPLLLTDSGDFLKPTQVFLPKASGSLSSVCGKTFFAVGLRAEFGPKLKGWGVRDLTTDMATPVIDRSEVIAVLEDKQLKRAAEIVQPWFFQVLRQYMSKEFPNSTFNRVRDDTKILFVEKLDCNWKFPAQDIQVGPEPVNAFMEDGAIYVRASVARQLVGLIELLVSTVIVAHVGTSTPTQIAAACNTMMACLFKAGCRVESEDATDVAVPAPTILTTINSAQLGIGNLIPQ